MNYKNIGAKIQKLRKEQKITQKELGNAISRTESSIAKYEQGLVEIPQYILEAIAYTLGVSVDYLLGYNTDPSPSSAQKPSFARVLGDDNTRPNVNVDGPLNSRHTAHLEPDDKFQVSRGALARADAAMKQMNEEGRSKVADYAEDILPRYRATDAPQSTPPPTEEQSTASAPDTLSGDK